MDQILSVLTSNRCLQVHCLFRSVLRGKLFSIMSNWSNWGYVLVSRIRAVLSMCSQGSNSNQKHRSCQIDQIQKKNCVSGNGYHRHQGFSFLPSKVSLVLLFFLYGNLELLTHVVETGRGRRKPKYLIPVIFTNPNLYFSMFSRPFEALAVEVSFTKLSNVNEESGTKASDSDMADEGSSQAWIARKKKLKRKNFFSIQLSALWRDYFLFLWQETMSTNNKENAVGGSRFRSTSTKAKPMAFGGTGGIGSAPPVAPTNAATATAQPRYKEQRYDSPAHASTSTATDPKDSVTLGSISQEVRALKSLLVQNRERSPRKAGDTDEPTFISA